MERITHETRIGLDIGKLGTRLSMADSASLKKAIKKNVMTEATKVESTALSSTVLAP